MSKKDHISASRCTLFNSISRTHIAQWFIFVLTTAAVSYAKEVLSQAEGQNEKVVSRKAYLALYSMQQWRRGKVQVPICMYSLLSSTLDNSALSLIVTLASVYKTMQVGRKEDVSLRIE